MTWIAASAEASHRCDLPSISGRSVGDWWICPVCELGHPVDEWEGQLYFSMPLEKPVWMFHTRHARPRKWWGR